MKSNFELWDDRPFLDCPLQLRTAENQVTLGAVRTGDVLEASLEEPSIPEEQRMAPALAHKLHLGH